MTNSKGELIRVSDGLYGRIRELQGEAIKQEKKRITMGQIIERYLP